MNTKIKQTATSTESTSQTDRARSAGPTAVQKLIISSRVVRQTECYKHRRKKKKDEEKKTDPTRDRNLQYPTQYLEHDSQTDRILQAQKKKKKRLDRKTCGTHHSTKVDHLQQRWSNRQDLTSTKRIGQTDGDRP